MTPIHIRRREIPKNQQHTLPDNLHPLLKRIYLGRGITRTEETDHSLQHLLPYHSLSGIETAAEILAEAAQKGEKILVIGDFDADGATSCAVAMRAFEMMGISNCHYLVPNRFEYGYGLTPEIVELATTESPALIMTVDNGISSIEGVARAKEHGIKVIVTDHHLAGETLPEADVIVNPNQPDDAFPSKAIAGVGVTFYLMLALRAQLRSLQWFDDNNRPYPNLGTLLDIVALGTVADVVPLDRNNRILVQQGLQRIRHGRACPGIQALLKIAKRQPQNCLASDLGFAVGPRLNAAGRIEHMSLGIECLLAKNADTAFAAAQTLDNLNQERRSIEAKMKEQALQYLNKLQQTTPQQTFSLCLYHPEWHQGVIGIVAARVKDSRFRPTIVFANDQDGIIKGSARSIPGYHIRDALDRIARKKPDLILKFGGHAMAAGLSIHQDDLEQFIHHFENDAQAHLNLDSFQIEILSEGNIEPEHLHLDTVRVLKHSEPWGQGFHEPVFDDIFLVQTPPRITARQGLIQVSCQKSNTRYEAATFRPDILKGLQTGNMVRIAYRMDINRYCRPERLRLMIEHIEPFQEEMV